MALQKSMDDAFKTDMDQAQRMQKNREFQRELDAIKQLPDYSANNPEHVQLTANIRNLLQVEGTYPGKNAPSEQMSQWAEQLKNIMDKVMDAGSTILKTVAGFAKDKTADGGWFFAKLLELSRGERAELVELRKLIPQGLTEADYKQLRGALNQKVKQIRDLLTARKDTEGARMYDLTSLLKSVRESAGGSPLNKQMLLQFADDAVTAEKPQAAPSGSQASGAQPSSGPGASSSAKA